MAVTQDELYATLDLDLSWSEAELPERERTKHVHRLHPYHGKFIPQLVEALLDRYLAPGDHVLDPFAGSGTTLVQALESGLDATGVDVAAFNCLLMRVKTARYDLPELGDELRDVRTRVEALAPRRPRRPREPYLRAWYAPGAAAELLAFRDLIPEYRHQDVLRVVLSRAARSARRAAHFDLEAPREPQVGEYWCHKHRRACRPVESAAGFLRRYALDTLARIEEFARVRDSEREARVVHGDVREAMPARPVRRHRHLAAVSGADRLPRAAPLRVRAARARRPAGAGDRRRRSRDVGRGARGVPGGRGPRARARVGSAAAGRAGARRRQRPPEPLPGDPRPGGTQAGRAAPPSRQPTNGSKGGRVLRGRPRRPPLVTAGSGRTATSRPRAARPNAAGA